MKRNKFTYPNLIPIINKIEIISFIEANLREDNWLKYSFPKRSPIVYFTIAG